MQNVLPRAAAVVVNGRFWSLASGLQVETRVKALKRSGWTRLVEETEEGLEDVAVFRLLPAAPGLQGEVTLGLLGGESVAGGDRAAAGTPMAL